jgi:tripartite-type tricarboxylate transporter receptor subunit TctC
MIGSAGRPAMRLTGLWVLKNTPKDIVAKLNAMMMKIIADPPVQQRFATLGIQITPTAQQSPEALRAFQKAEVERWWPIINAANLRAQ